MSKTQRSKNRIRLAILLVTMVCVFGAAFATMAAPRTVTMVDVTKKSVTVPVAPQRVICMSSSMNEILVALDASNSLIGRDDNSTFPPSLLKLPVVATTSYTPNIEAVIEKKPDLIIADTMLQDDARRKFESFGIPVIVEAATDPTRTDTLIRNFGLIFNRQQRAEDLISFLSKNQNIMTTRLAKLTDAQKPRVFWEMLQPYKTCTKAVASHQNIVKAGAINVAADLAGTYPVVSAEWLAKVNPQLIIRMASRDDSDQVVQQIYDEVMSRPALSTVDAVRNKKVYIVKWSIYGGLRSLVSQLYYVKWIHPDLFADIDPAAVHKELLTRFLGVTTFSYEIYPVK